MEPRHLFRAIRAIFLDFETTVVATEHLRFEAYQRALGRWNRPITFDKHNALIGRSRRETCERLIAQLQLDAPWSDVAKGYDEAYRSLLEEGHVPVYRAALRFLRAIPPDKYFRCLASTLPMERIEPIVEGARLGRFFDLVVAGENLPSKPHADFYFTVIETAAVTPGVCVVIEGSEAGILSAARAGARTVAVVRGAAGDRDFSGAHLRVDSLESLIPYL